jgi:hypothetical protein
MEGSVEIKGTKQDQDFWVESSSGFYTGQGDSGKQAHWQYKLLSGL